MNRDLARLIILAETKRDKRPVPEKLRDLKFPEQDAFVHDTSDFVAALCSRRAGKSVGFGKRAIRAMYRHPGFTVPYIGLTRESSYNIMWPILWQLNRQYGLGAKLHESDLRMELRNGSNYKLFGADMKNFVERLRGGKYSEAHIDEAQSFRSHLSKLIDDVLGPALGDLRGPLALGGTPGPIPSGIFYDASLGKLGFSAHRWTVFKNPYFRDPKAFVEKLKREKGWSDQNPTYLREWLGQWVRDDDALVYKFNPDKNLYDELPKDLHWNHILAIDYGWNDQTAFSIVAFSKQSPHVFIRYVEGKSEMVPSAIAERIKQLVDQFKPISIIADTGGLGKSITEEFIRRYHIAITAADKREKLTFINLLNGDFIDGRCFVHRSLIQLHDQYLSLQKAENPTPTKYEDPTMKNDLCDATLYAYRKAKHYLGQTPKTFASEEEKWKAYEKELEDKEVEIVRAQNSKEWWERL